MQSALLLLTSKSTCADSPHLLGLSTVLLTTISRSFSGSAYLQAEQSTDPAASSADSFAAKQAHVQAKKQFRSELSDLRKQWLEEGRRKAAAKAKALAKQQADAKARRAQKQNTLLEQQEVRYLKHQREQEVERLIKGAKFQQAKKWRETLASVYDKYRSEREAQLLEDSRHWIRPEDLDARIEEALDNEVLLYHGEAAEYLTREQWDPAEESQTAPTVAEPKEDPPSEAVPTPKRRPRN